MHKQRISINKFQPEHLKTTAINRSAFVLFTFAEIVLLKKQTHLTNDDCSDLMLCF